jgi:hypothetical protein
MNRLQPELNRLYLGGLVFAQDEAQSLSLVDARGRVRALVLEVVQPTRWDALSEVWHGVQMELELPAPAIAVSGRDGLQLWFSLETAVPVGLAREFLDALRVRFLGHIPPARVRMWPTSDTPAQHAAHVPAPQADDEHWSAFVAPDLAALFSETPWLDVEPGDEGQAVLLRGLHSIKPATFDAALAGMRASAPHAQAPALTPSPARETAGNAPDPADEPRRFLLRVMNDESVALALRIEAAKALLPPAH